MLKLCKRRDWHFLITLLILRCLKKYKTGAEMGWKNYYQENEKIEPKTSLTDLHLPLTGVINTMSTVVKPFPYYCSLGVSISRN